jgi:hypothetical protein
MTKTYWKRIVPHSINHALQLTKQHALEHNNLSVPRIADQVMATPDTLYKWLGQGKMPVNAIIAFEQACGINFVTQYLAHSQGYLLVKVPTGRKAEHKDLTELQIFMTEVSALLIKSSEGRCNASDTIDGIKTLMEDLAFHQKNVAAVDEPQTEFSLG